MGEIHELSVLALSLVWFAGATPDYFEALCYIGPHSRLLWRHGLKTARRKHLRVQGAVLQGVLGPFGPSVSTDVFQTERSVGPLGILLLASLSASSRPPEFAQPCSCLSRVNGRSSPARGYKFGCVFVPIWPVSLRWCEMTPAI